MDFSGNLELFMTDIKENLKTKEIDEFVSHYGVRGMKWGQRKKRSSKSNISNDGKRAEYTLEKLKKGGKRSLSNPEIRDLNKRLELEQRLDQLLPKKKNHIKIGHDFTKQALAVGATMNGVYRFSKSPAGKKIKDSFVKDKGSSGDREVIDLKFKDGVWK